MKINLKGLFKWAVARAKEPSTYTGLAVIAGMVGVPQLVVPIKVAGSILGGALVAATTTPALPSDASTAG